MGVSNTSQAKIAPCQEACPAGVAVPRYVRHLRDGRFSEALAVIRERIPFPLVCGYACFHPCEAKCGRRQLDMPVAIRMLKRAAAEGGAQGHAVPAPLAGTGRKVAIIGSGPCGLTGAYYLALQGHAATVFEALPRAGGMLRFGIPAYRLPDAVVDADIRVIEQSGVKIRTGTRIKSAEALLARGFDAVFIASGAWRGAKMGIPGEDRAEVIDGMSFLTAVNAGKAPNIGARVIVVGGGNTAIDAARVSRRLGAEVIQLYRRTRAEMPAADEEVAAALEEGVQIEYLAAPVRIDKGSVTCLRMKLGAADASGRRQPLPVTGSEHAIAASAVIIAIGQQVVVPSEKVARSENGTVSAQAETLATCVPGIFAGGDAVTGSASIIDAIAQGRRAAVAIDRYLGGSGAIDRLETSEEPACELPDAAARGTLRHALRLTPPEQRLNGFALVEQVYERDAAMQEAGRCLSCDLREFDVQVDALACKDCGYCLEVCELDVFKRSEQFNPGGYRPAVAEQAKRCIGCLRCLQICPDFAITITDRSVLQDYGRQYRPLLE